ncbi:hypothetical protein [Aliivibrio wodanis]|uniref:hypothetical protein n=1 Tax=Aliivibrio wodanis TaxID=80852 RepID=UPI00406D1CDB
MKIYFLVEGISSEMQVYPEWIKHFIPTLTTFISFKEFKESDSGCYFFSGEGYPSILNHIKNAVDDIKSDGSVDYFFIILDSDEETIEYRRQLILNEIDKLDIPERLNVIPVVQSRCFETILLGNKLAMPRFPKKEPLISYYQYFNVVNDNPEQMGNYDDDFTHSQFHSAYAMKALRERRINYSKSNCSGVASPEYFANVCNRVENTGDLSCILPLINTLEEISNKLDR